MKKIITIFLLLASSIMGYTQTPSITLQTVVTGLSKPLGIENCGDSRLFIVQQRGKIIVCDSNYVKATLPFLDLTNKVSQSGNELGLLGLAFEPNYLQTGRFYVNYTKTVGSNYTSVVSRFYVSTNDPNRADSLSEEILFTQAQPYSNHNGGSLKFGPDGYLYCSFGDGGSGNDPEGNGQDISTILGKILRIDVTSNITSYSVPTSNPFVGVSGADERIWAYGIRNAWRITFDRINGDFWIADVGQNAVEEINFEPVEFTGGRNYGWRCYEASVSTGLGTGVSGLSCPASTDVTFPIHEYNHTNGDCSLTGGYVYRGANIGLLYGHYVFCDYCSGAIRMLSNDGNYTSIPLLNSTDFAFTSFGEDKWGELYVCNTSANSVQKFTDNTDCFPTAVIIESDSISICNNENYNLVAIAGQNFNYQWLLNSVEITNSNNYSYLPLASGTYQVIATDANGCSAISDSVFVTLKESPSAEITNLIDTLCSDVQTYPYTLNVSPTGGIFEGTNVTGNVVNLTVNTISTFTYTYTDQTTLCSDVATGSIYYEYCLSVKNVNSSKIIVHPNPAHDLVRVSANENIFQVRIIDLLGKEILIKTNINSREFSLPIQTIKAGMYLIELEAGNSKNYQKLTIY